MCIRDGRRAVGAAAGVAVEVPGVADDAVMLVEPVGVDADLCLLYTSPSPRDRTRYRMPSSA